MLKSYFLKTDPMITNSLHCETCATLSLHLHKFSNDSPNVTDPILMRFRDLDLFQDHMSNDAQILLGLTTFFIVSLQRRDFLLGTRSFYMLSVSNLHGIKKIVFDRNRQMFQKVQPRSSIPESNLFQEQDSNIDQLKINFC